MMARKRLVAGIETGAAAVSVVFLKRMTEYPRGTMAFTRVASSIMAGCLMSPALLGCRHAF